MFISVLFVQQTDSTRQTRLLQDLGTKSTLDIELLTLFTNICTYLTVSDLLRSMCESVMWMILRWFLSVKHGIMPPLKPDVTTQPAMPSAPF